MPGALTGLLLALLQAPQAQADLRCVIDQVSAADRAALGESARRLAESLGPAGDRIREAASSCRQRLGWSAQRAGNVAALALSTILLGETARMLAQAGIPPERIERWFGGQSLPVRTDPARIEQSSRELVEALGAQGYSFAAIETQGHLIGIYFGARLVIERFERGLPLAE